MPLNLPTPATPPMMPNMGGNDPLQQLRLAGIFGQNPPPNQPQPGGMSGGMPIDFSQLGAGPTPGGIPPSPDMGMDMGMGGQPSTIATEAFQELLNAYPTEGRGVLEKIALSMLGLKDPRLAASISQSPTSDQQAWQQQIGPAQAAMTQERFGNVNLRQMAESEQRGQQADRTATRLEGQASETVSHNRATEALAIWKAEHPNYQFKTRDDGMIVGVNPQNPQDIQETGVNSGDLTDQEKIDAQVDAAEVAETGRVSRAATAESGRVSRQKTGIKAGQENIQERERLRGERPSSARTGSRSQSDINRGRLNRASEVLARNPEYSQFIKLDGTRLTIEPWKKKGILFKGSGLSKEEYDLVVSQIYDESSGGTTTEVMEKPIPDGSGMAISHDGGKTWQRK